MVNRKQKLILEQTDRKLKPFLPLLHTAAPDKGWVYTIRNALNMSLSQIGKRIGLSPQGIRALELREKNGQISLKSLKEIARAMDMQLVYALVPKDGSLEEMVDKRAMEIAKDIVNRTSQSMKLEDQENPKDRLMRAFEEKKNELKNEIPKFLWD